MGEHVAALARRPDGLLGALTRDRHPGLTDSVLDALANSADPEQAARYLRAFFGKFLAPAAYVNALGDDPRALQALDHRLRRQRVRRRCRLQPSGVGRRDLVRRRRRE